MTREELDRMWAVAMEDAISAGEMFTRYRFAALVAAAERERLKWDGIHSCGPTCSKPACVRLRNAVEAEREACARTVERARLQLGGEQGLTNDTDHIASRISEFLAQAIRARGEA